MRFSARATVLAVLTLALPVRPFECAFTASSIDYDLTPLSGVRHSTKMTETPPTKSVARVSMNLCSTDGVPREGSSDEDQCPPNTRVCLTLVNTKQSAPDPDRVTAVIPIWPVDQSEDQIRLSAVGRDGQDGLKISVDGADYAGVQQRLNLTLVCDTGASEADPRFVSYSDGLLSLEWATPDACPRSGEGAPEDRGGGGGGMGFFGFIKFIFWLGVFALILYFGIGIFYNHQQYSARGWDLVPHRDFWREFPALAQDLFSHIFAGLRGSGSGRGGYSSLG